MLSKIAGLPRYRRSVGDIIAKRIEEPRRFIQVLAGPRQTGKTTLVQQILSRYTSPWHYASADEPSLRGGMWIDEQWNSARFALQGESTECALLVLDEV